MSKRSTRGRGLRNGLFLAIGLAVALAVPGPALLREWRKAGVPNLSDVVPSAVAQSAPAEPGAKNPLVTGHVETFRFKATPEPLADIPFQDGTGKDRKLSDWKGKVVLLNLWATWCVPCRKEMPALDRLQATLGSDAFEVLALSVDKAGAASSKKFLADTKAEKLALYVDPTARASNALKVLGLPTTILIGRDGLEVGRLIGPAEWDSEEAKALLQSVIAGK